MHSQYQLLPPLSTAEYSALKADIAARGVMVPVEKDEAGNTLDGFHREQICRELNIDFPVTRRLGMSEDEKIHHALALNLERRHLDTEQRRELVLTLKKSRGWPNERIGEVLGVDETTVRRDLDSVSAFAETEFPRTIGKDGKSYPPRKPRTVISRNQKEDAAVIQALGVVGSGEGEESEIFAPAIIQEARATIAEANRSQRLHERQQAANRNHGAKCRLIHSDITKLAPHIAADSLDAIITDPPYPQEYLPLYGILAQFAGYALRPGGSLLVMSGQSYLPEVFAMMSGHLEYYWTLSAWTPGEAPHLWQRKVNTNWKPILWFVKGKFDGETIGDVLKSDGNDKNFHHWGQNESSFVQLVERFTVPGEIVCDPFLGGGTTAAAALNCGRRFVGSDSDEKAIQTTRQRLGLTAEMAGAS